MYRGAEVAQVQMCKGVAEEVQMQRCKGGAERCRGAELKSCRAAQVPIWRFAELQRCQYGGFELCRCTEVHIYGGAEVLKRC